MQTPPDGGRPPPVRQQSGPQTRLQRLRQNCQELWWRSHPYVALAGRNVIALNGSHRQITGLHEHSNPARGLCKASAECGISEDEEGLIFVLTTFHERAF